MVLILTVFLCLITIQASVTGKSNSRLNQKKGSCVTGPRRLLSLVNIIVSWFYFTLVQLFKILTVAWEKAEPCSPRGLWAASRNSASRSPASASPSSAWRWPTSCPRASWRRPARPCWTAPGSPRGLSRPTSCYKWTFDLDLNQRPAKLEFKESLMETDTTGCLEKNILLGQTFLGSYRLL